MKLQVVSYDEVYYPVVSCAKLVGTEQEKTPDVNEAAETTVLVNVAKGASRRRGGLRSWGAKLGMVAMSLVVASATILVGMRLAGFRTFTVLSGSMEPNYPVGAMIYVQPRDYQELKVGDVISYVANDDKVVVTHRIVEIVIDENDATVRRFRTKGDTNDVTDAGLVHYKNVLGTPIITIPLIGYIAFNIQQPPGIYIMLVAGTLLLAWAFLPGTLEERRKTARKSIANS